MPYSDWFSDALRNIEGSNALKLELLDHLNELWSAQTARDSLRAKHHTDAILSLMRERREWRVELLARHWALQTRLTNCEGTASLREAVDLVAFAHQPRGGVIEEVTCAGQDLLFCYINIDELGYARESLQAYEEMLATVAPRHQCYPCLARGKTRALLVNGDAEGSRRFMAACEQRCVQSGADPSRLHGTEHRADALFAEGRPDDAMQELAKLSKKNADKIGVGMLKARIWLRLGDVTAAVSALPPLEHECSTDHADWIEVLAALVLAGGIAVTDARVERASRIPHLLEAAGALRPAAIAWRARAQLCELAGDLEGRREAQARVEALTAELRAAL